MMIRALGEPSAHSTEVLMCIFLDENSQTFLCLQETQTACCSFLLPPFVRSNSWCWHKDQFILSLIHFWKSSQLHRTIVFLFFELLSNDQEDLQLEIFIFHHSIHSLVLHCWFLSCFLQSERVLSVTCREASRSKRPNLTWTAQLRWMKRCPSYPQSVTNANMK